MTCEPHTIGYTVNGFPQGVAFCVSSSALNGQALFPHILTKNQNFTVNFGQLPAPIKPLMPNFIPIGQLDLNDGLLRGPVAPLSKRHCEVLLMIGLPGAGKTFWAEKYRKQNPEKYYNILGTNNLIDRMKVMGLPRSRNYHGRWEVLIEKCTDCFNTLLKVASRRKRNYILDQTNVFPTARGRKIKDFQDMCCKAIVVVPNDQEFQRRCMIRNQESGKEIPETAVVNMKANFVLPELEEVQSNKFSAVFYVELGPQQARELVQMYNMEATSKGVHMTTAVKHFISRNAKLRADANMFEPIGMLLSNPEVTLSSCTKTEESVLEQNRSGMKLMNSALPYDEKRYRITNNTLGNIPTVVDHINLSHERKSKSDEQQINSYVEDSYSKFAGVKDEFGRDVGLEQISSQDKNVLSDQQNLDKRESHKDRSIHRRDMHRNKIDGQRDSRRSRSRGRDRQSRSKSRDRKREGGGFNRRNSFRRSRSRSSERRDHVRRRKSRDRRGSRDGGGFDRNLGFRRSSGRTGSLLPD